MPASSHPPGSANESCSLHRLSAQNPPSRTIIAALEHVSQQIDDDSIFLLSTVQPRITALHNLLHAKLGTSGEYEDVLAKWEDQHEKLESLVKEVGGKLMELDAVVKECVSVMLGLRDEWAYMGWCD